MVVGKLYTPLDLRVHAFGFAITDSFLQEAGADAFVAVAYADGPATDEPA